MPLYAIPFPPSTRADQLRAIAIRLVRARLHRRHPAGLALCARADPARAALGRAAPMTVADYDDFRAVGDARIILGGRLGYVLCYNPPFSPPSLEILSALEGGHVVPRRLSVGCVLAVILFARHRACRSSRSDITCGRRSNFSRPHRQFHQWRAVGPDTDLRVGHGVPTGGPVAAPTRAALRSAARRTPVVFGADRADPAGALKRPGFILARSRRLRRRALDLRILSRADAQIPTCGIGLTMGTLLSLPLLLVGIALMVAACGAKRTAA